MKTATAPKGLGKTVCSAAVVPTLSAPMTSDSDQATLATRRG